MQIFQIAYKMKFYTQTIILLNNSYLFPEKVGVLEWHVP